MKKNIILSFLLTAAFLVCCHHSFAAKKVDKVIGLQLYSLRDDIGKDFATTVKDAGAMGYKYIEAANYGDGKFYGLTPEAFKKAIEGAGMKVLSSHTGHGLPDDPSTANWDDVWKWWDQCIDAHKAAGMKYIVTPSMPKPKTLKDLKVYCDYYNKIGQKCAAKGMKFGYHNHDFEFGKIEDQVMYDFMIENTDPKHVIFEMDVYWVVRAGRGPVNYFKKYPGRFELLHIKDDKELGESGMVGFDAIFKYAKEAGVKYLIVEVESYNYSPKKSVELSLEYLLNAPFVKADYSK